jgi:hypothetical protein
MHQKIKQYKKNLKLKRHESGDRWYSPEDLNMWRPSVTTIIGNTIHKGIGFEMWLGNHPSYKIACEERDAAASRGTEVHELAERYMLGDEVSGSTDEINKHLMSFEKFWLEKEVQLIETELFMWHKDVPWAGTCDIIAKIDGKYSIIDIKTGNYYKSHEIQLNMYAELFNKIAEEYNMPKVEKIYGLYTKGKWKKEPNYQLKSFKFDLEIALAVNDLWKFLMGGKPWPKAKLQIKTSFKKGADNDKGRLQEL